MTSLMIGPTGGSGGQEFMNYTVPAGTRIKEIRMYTTELLNAFQIVYVDAEGKRGYMPKIGGQNGKQHVFILEDDEYLTCVSGCSGWYIDGLRFHTNKRLSDWYGGSNGENQFEFQAIEGHEVAGFFGRADWYIDALGIITRSRTEKPESFGTARQEAKPKELQKVEGIGPKIAALLIEQGVYDLRGLSQTSVGRLREILETGGKRYALADPTTWPEQAALGTRGDWEALKKLQAELSGGRRTT